MRECDSDASVRVLLETIRLAALGLRVRAAVTSTRSLSAAEKTGNNQIVCVEKKSTNGAK